MAEITMKKSSVNNSITFLNITGKSKKKRHLFGNDPPKMKEFITEERKERRREPLIGCYVSLCSDCSEHSVNTPTKSKDWQDSGNFMLVKLENSNKSFISQRLI